MPSFNIRTTAQDVIKAFAYRVMGKNGELRLVHLIARFTLSCLSPHHWYYSGVDWLRDC